jgi:hypothetical protein
VAAMLYHLFDISIKMGCASSWTCLNAGRREESNHHLEEALLRRC